MYKKTEHSIEICMGSACFARGNEKNLQIIEDFISKNSLQADITLAGLRCTSKCKNGPNIIIDGRTHKINSEKELLNILKRL